MLPERHRAGFALQRRRADSAPRGAPSTGLLQGLIQGSRPAFFCFSLPRVHAADVAAAQSAQMPSSSSSTTTTSPASVPVPSHSTLPSVIGKPEFPDSGWERIKELFDRDPQQSYPEEISNAIMSTTFGALIGFFYGGMPAARYARQRYIQMSQAELYSSRVDAVRSAHNAAIRGFLRYGWRWSWRVAVIVTLFNSVNTGLSVYRDKDAVSHYVAAGAVTFGLFRLNLGLRGLVAGTVIGAVLGTPVGALLMGLQSLAGETIRERKRRERRELYELKLEEWTARLQLTDNLIDGLDVAARPEEATKDAQRIQELLSLPRNEGESEESGGQ